MTFGHQGKPSNVNFLLNAIPLFNIALGDLGAWGYTCAKFLETTIIVQGHEMSDLKNQFEATVNYVQNAEGGDFQPSNELKLKMYALYKQATEGDVSGKKPGMMDFVARAKYTAWEEVKGMSSDEAMQQYITEIEALK